MDNDDVKSRIRKAVEKFSKPSTTRHTKNEKPELRVLGAIVAQLKDVYRASVDRVESKGYYSAAAGRYMQGITRNGFADLVGNFDNGQAFFIEVKAPGKRSTLRAEQRDFLIEKINTGCFAIVCDSVQYLDAVIWAYLKSPNPKDFLLRELPIPRAEENSRQADFSID